MSQELLHSAIDSLKAGGFLEGEAWEKAHKICHEHEGTPLFNWLHALVHRIEGDDANAGHWYQRADKVRHSGSIEEGWQIIRLAIDKV